MKRILIIGATSAIAEACAREWAQGGAALFLVGRRQDALAQVAADLTARGATVAHCHLMDVNEHQSHADMLKVCAETLGQIDIALVAHGTLADQAACERDVELTLKEFTLNATSTISLLTLLAQQMVRQGRGALAVITSVAGERGRASNYVYGSAKAAVSVFCEGLRARTRRDGVQVVDVRPGFVATPMTEGIALPPFLVAEPAAVARRITAGIDRGSDVIYAPWYWSVIMAGIRSIPRIVFKRMTI